MWLVSLPQMPTDLPCSVSLQPGPNDSGKVPPPLHHHPDLQSPSNEIINADLSRSVAGLWRGLWGQSIPRQRCPQSRWGHREEVRIPEAKICIRPDFLWHTKSLVLTVCVCVFFYFLFFSSVRDTCRLMIRKIQFAPANNKAGPTTEISKQFMMNDKPVQLEASLEKEVRCNTCAVNIWPLQRNAEGFCFLSFTNKSFSNSDLLPRRTSHCQRENQQRNQQGREESQSHR